MKQGGITVEKKVKTILAFLLAFVLMFSMTACSVKAFVQAATGEIPFTDFSPVHLTSYEEEIACR